MRVAVVSPYDLAAPGGVQEQVGGLVEHLRRAGHDAWAVAPGSGGPEGTRHVGRPVAVPANRSRAPIALCPGTGRRVREAVGGADVVHVHEPLMPMVSLAATARCPVPAVGTFHADPGPVVRRVYRGAAPVLRRLVGRLAVVTAVSETARAAIAGLAGARIVPNGVDVAAYRAAGTGRVPGRVLFVGRDERRKGLDVLLEAWPEVRAAHPGAVLRVVGCRREEAPAGVEFLGRVPEARKREELAAASVFAAPNLGGESFGIVLVEAMAAGAPVVASDLPAFRAVAGDAGVLVAPGDAAALGGAVAALLGDAAGSGEASAAGVRTAQRYDWPGVVGAYLQAYREAAGTSG